MAVGAWLLKQMKSLSQGLLAKLTWSKERFRCIWCGVLSYSSDAWVTEDKQRCNSNKKHNPDISNIWATSYSSLSESTGVDARLRVRQWPEITWPSLDLGMGASLNWENLTICSVRDIIWRTQVQFELQPTEHVTVGITAYRIIHNR